MFYGIKPKVTVVARGDFCCPQCQKNTTYTRKKVDNYLTFLYLPLKRTSDRSLVDYVECSNCEKQFHSSPNLLLDGVASV